MEYLETTLEPAAAKRNLVLFPHRIAPEKQVDIFKDLAASLPEYEFVVCQEQQLAKAEYHALLSQAKVVFSANLQETLGISWYEAAIAGAVPLVPDRLSYSEMAVPELKYPSHWTTSYSDYTANKQQMIERIRTAIEEHESYANVLRTQIKILSRYFFACDNLAEKIVQCAS